MMTRMFRRCVFLILLFAVLPVQAQADDPELKAARDVFLQGVDGDKQAVRKAVNRFRALSRRFPDEPVYLAYFGAALTLQGRDAANNIDKQRFSEDGLGKIDRALTQLPSDRHLAPRTLETLLVAADSFIYMPAFFNRYDRGRELLQKILDDPGFDAMAPGFKAAVYFTAALVAQGDQDQDGYRHYLALAARTDPQGRDGRTAAELLAER